MDDNMGNGTPNFFNSAWDPEQSDFTDNYQGNGGNYLGYAQNYNPTGQENNQMDYFQDRSVGQFVDNQQGFNSNFSQTPTRPVDDVNQILTPSLSFLNMDLDVETEKAFSAPPRSYPVMGQIPVTRGMDPYSSVFESNGLDLQIGQWANDIQPKALTVATSTNNGTDRTTSVMHGQITPGDSPQDDETVPKRTGSGTSQILPSPAEAAARSARGKRASTTLKPEVTEEASVKPAKKPRKSKKKPITKEQEEAKRKKFLERNRVAADKCRQNRKKWIDDLQDKCHSYSTDNAIKKAALEEMEHEIMQLKSMLLVHSRNCKDPTIMAWMDKETSRMSESRSTKGEDVSMAPQQLLADVASPKSQQSSSSRGSTPVRDES